MAHDMEAAQEFYSNLFGWSAVPQDTQGGPRYTIFQLQGKAVAGLGAMPDEMKAQGIPAIWSSYVNVDDVESVVGRVAELGGQVTMPPMQVVEAGSMAIVQDQTGGDISLWQKKQHIGAELTNGPGCFCWNELATREIEQACDFYGALLGWEFEWNEQSTSKYYMIKNNGRHNGGIMQMDENWGEMPPCWSVYFTVEKVDATVTEITSRGGKVLVPAFDVSIGRMAVVSDVQGAAFDLFEFGENAQMPN